MNCEIKTLGYPKAALFAFCMALVAYNILSVVKAALRSVHGAGKIDAGISSYYLASGNPRYLSRHDDCYSGERMADFWADAY